MGTMMLRLRYQFTVLTLIGLCHATGCEFSSHNPPSEILVRFTKKRVVQASDGMPGNVGNTLITLHNPKILSSNCKQEVGYNVETYTIQVERKVHLDLSHE